MLNTLVNKLSIHNGLQSVLFVRTVVFMWGGKRLYAKRQMFKPYIGDL